ncbi:STAS domain-containing protein [Azospirillum halopraeferens]|uniref:STAS domain-containing protein n=1 Tax=Azospirillum halopraeferens TaxID=34010 RepID=UPI00040F02E0|nr:STAS domain-containing protein [Azospirillum halopraeferens]
MDVTIRSAPGATEIRLHGRLTYGATEAFRAALDGMAGPAGHGVVVDLGALEFLDSSGIGMLIVARDLARKRGLAFTLRAGAGDLERLPALARWRDLFALSE